MRFLLKFLSAILRLPSPVAQSALQIPPTPRRSRMPLFRLRIGGSFLQAGPGTRQTRPVQISIPLIMAEGVD